MLNEIGNRIEQLRVLLKLTQGELAKGIGITQPNISDIQSGKTKISTPILLAIEYIYGVRKEWILTGEGEIFKEREIFSEGDEEDYCKVPLVDGKIAAGPGRIIPENEIRSYVWLYSPKLIGRKTHRLLAVEIGEREESMTPTLFPGDIVLIDRDDPRGSMDFKTGKIYGIRTKGGECQIKRVFAHDHTLIIGSDNRERSPESSWTDDIKKLIIGRVVWGWRNLLEV